MFARRECPPSSSQGERPRPLRGPRDPPVRAKTAWIGGVRRTSRGGSGAHAVRACGRLPVTASNFDSSSASLRLDLLDRVRAVVNGEPTTEAELRNLCEAGDAWVRLLEARIAGSERRLRLLGRERAPGLAEASRELQRLEAIRPHLMEARRLLIDLETRARQLRTTWTIGEYREA